MQIFYKLEFKYFFEFKFKETKRSFLVIREHREMY
jgi:hypothetical protein